MKLLFSILAGLWLAVVTVCAQTAGSLTVTVQTPDGKPLTNVTVVCIDAATRGALIGTNIQGGSERFQTDAKGQFTFSLQRGDLAFMVSTDKGFGLGQIRDLTNAPAMIVYPWGRLEGTRTNRGRPMAGQSILLILDVVTIDNPDHIVAQSVATTDSKGRFTFDRVPYLNMVLAETMPPGDLLHILRRITVRPGQSKTVNIATDGRTIAAHMEFNDDSPKIPGAISFDVSLVSLGASHVLLSPISPDFDTAQKRVQWWADQFDLAASQQMEGFLPPDQGNTAFDVQPDGSLISQLKMAPGTYWVTGDLTQGGNRVARINQFVDIPPDKAGDTNNTYDAGGFIVKPLMQVGSTAPDFDVQTFDGKRLKLSDLRGKYVLLDFWATWCVPCIYEMPNLIDTYNAFGKDSRFVMLGMNLDADPAVAKKFAMRNGLAWTDATLGDWDRDKVTKTYEIDGIPSIWLIGPDGKIIASNLRGPAIKEVVTEALSAK
jgi:thiol-disulfide isomerase/thioredoxin